MKVRFCAGCMKMTFFSGKTHRKWLVWAEKYFVSNITNNFDLYVSLFLYVSLRLVLFSHMAIMDVIVGILFDVDTRAVSNKPMRAGHQSWCFTLK